MSVRSCLTLALALLLALPAAAQFPEGISAIADQTTNLRSGPDTRYDITGQLQAEDAVMIIGRTEDARWLRVRAPSGAEGWVPAYALIYEGDVQAVPVESAPDSETGEVWVTAYGRVNVRAAPDISAEIIGQMEIGTRALASARCCTSSDWLLIELPQPLADPADAAPTPTPEATPHTPRRGWVAYFTVSITGDLNALPILTTGGAPGSLVTLAELVSARFNVRLHSTPAIDSPTIAIVPFEAAAQPLARTADGQWLYVAYDGLEGWGSAGLFAIGAAALSALPVIAPEDVPVGS